jgi:predicted dehydrogenase
MQKRLIISVSGTILLIYEIRIKLTEAIMSSSNRRDFMKRSAMTVGAMVAAPVVKSGFAQNKPSNQVNVAVVGFGGRGQAHYKEFARQKGVKVVALCDVDERLFRRGVSAVEKIAGYKPKTYYDIRKLLEDKDVDAISIATPDHWHGLMTIWACQAGKDVYVEKPISFTIEEGRKMVQAARKYNRVVQAGLNMRSSSGTRSAVRYLHEGNLGNVYRSKAIIYKGRASIGKTKDSAVPRGVHWDLFLGPAPYRPFNMNRFHYGWHFFWDTSTADMGNTGVHLIDVSRWGMNKRVHPVKVHCAGGLYVWDSDQETPNVQTASVEYADGSIMDIEVTNLYTQPIGGILGTGNFFYTSEGYLSSANGYEAVRGQFVPRTPDVDADGINHHASNVSFPARKYTPRTNMSEWEGKVETIFIDCVRSRRWQDLYCDILDGHMSTSICHLANISFRTGRKLEFNPHVEKFVNDDDANGYLTRQYRHPYILPKEV